MTVNEQILEVFKEFKIFPSNGICYLIALYHGYDPTYIPDLLKQKVNATGIISVKDKNIHWNIPLYENQVTAFEWVKTEYVAMFKAANSDKGGNVRESISRMKKLFAKNPDVRKDDVIGATRMYLLNTDVRFIRNPHYFIEKGVGVNKTSDILDWIDKYKLTKNQQVGRTSHTNTMR